MKKKFLLSVLAFGMVMFGSIYTINAEDESTSTDATIAFTGGDTSPTSPVDPDNPDTPGTNPGTNMEGPLSLDYVPALAFGTHEITGNVATYDLTDLKPYIQVTDKRGTGKGWKVSVSMTTFTNGDSSSSFSGVLSFKNPEVKTTTGNTSTPPTASVATVTSGAGEQKLVGTNADNQGMGTWITRWYPTASATNNLNDAIQLTVNTGNATTDSYTATVNWIISNAP
ncbi:hypothetical protein M2475_001930 [Breznakia sp. PF5-3]|uniref:WxL domain-containing protein n=1 Tax=unclassified Breznakia TaxID=2623764 RepID=UPI002405EE50|nr:MULTISPECIES: WxL domain-containing protein [unclassified Breznakia]MDF9825465.1 hypothetical protein [Breznakia sp. PM6-1]MDF9836350.1 hypothetical protein [Breznakia sp. PF5-3]MDF9838755.1 hypothetical protein [Breznakia sp. PFB2-8]MDF9860783.1 hypothetical protein [Breznakia sp. PH5-24]